MAVPNTHALTCHVCAARQCQSSRRPQLHHAYWDPHAMLLCGHVSCRVEALQALELQLQTTISPNRGCSRKSSGQFQPVPPCGSLCSQQPCQLSFNSRSCAAADVFHSHTSRGAHSAALLPAACLARAFLAAMIATAAAERQLHPSASACQWCMVRNRWRRSAAEMAYVARGHTKRNRMAPAWLLVWAPFGLGSLLLQLLCT